MTDKPKALELADKLESKIDPVLHLLKPAAAELRRFYEIAEKYAELLYAVQTKHPYESRHQTALRYITQAEQRSDMCESAKEST